MGIEYQRNMSIKYGKKLDTIEFNKLAADLADKGVFLVDHWQAVDTKDYGYQEVTENTITYQIVVDDEVIMNVDWHSDAELIVEGFSPLHPNIESRSIKTEMTTKKWLSPNGHVLQLSLPLDGEIQAFDEWGRNRVKYSEVSMVASLYNYSSGVELVFELSWNCENVQRKDAIEDAMVKAPLNDMGTIQRVIENRLKLKKYGFDVDDVEIDCEFHVVSESRSECTPDIVKQVREARKK